MTITVTSRRLCFATPDQKEAIMKATYAEAEAAYQAAEALEAQADELSNALAGLTVLVDSRITACERFLHQTRMHPTLPIGTR